MDTAHSTNSSTVSFNVASIFIGRHLLLVDDGGRVSAGTYFWLGRVLLTIGSAVGYL